MNRRTRYIAIAAEHTAVTGFGFEASAAAFAVVEKLAGIGWHGFPGLMAAVRTGDD